MQRLVLSLPTLGERRLLLKALDGHAELASDPADPGAVHRLLGRILLESTGTAVEVPDLLVAWRDRVFAALFEREFGGRVESRARCTACGEEYEFGFALADIMASQEAAAAATGLVVEPSGRFVLDDGAWVRPPTIGDLMEHDDPEALSMALCGATTSRERVEGVLDGGAPLLALDLATTCAECQTDQALRFDVVCYFLESLAAERPLLVRETHLIASRYGWGHDTIMDLTRGDRRSYAGLILAERGAATGLRSAG